MTKYMGFVDAGYLRARCANILKQDIATVNFDPSGVVSWLREFPKHKVIEYWGAGQFLRAYWYDGAYPSTHDKHKDQMGYFKSIAAEPCVRLRLGVLVERPIKYTPALRKAVSEAADAIGVPRWRLNQELEKRLKKHPQRNQKGVDTLIALDMARFAARKVCDTMVLMSGDDDLTEVVRVVQDTGCKVAIATPDRRTVSAGLKSMADEIIDIPKSDLAKMFKPPKEDN